MARRKSLKKPYRYMAVAGNVVDGEEFPVTKKQKQFKLPWRVHGKGLKGKLV